MPSDALFNLLPTQLFSNNKFRSHSTWIKQRQDRSHIIATSYSFWPPVSLFLHFDAIILAGILHVICYLGLVAIIMLVGFLSYCYWHLVLTFITLLSEDLDQSRS